MLRGKRSATLNTVFFEPASCNATAVDQRVNTCKIGTRFQKSLTSESCQGFTAAQKRSLPVPEEPPTIALAEPIKQAAPPRGVAVAR